MFKIYDDSESATKYEVLALWDYCLYSDFDYRLYVTTIKNNYTLKLGDHYIYRKNKVERIIKELLQARADFMQNIKRGLV
jgi:hypothetical protein